MTELYTQCHLIKKVSGHTLEEIVWIPHKFATKDRLLKIKKEEEWEDGWRVHVIYGTASRLLLDSGHKAHKRFEEVLNV